MRHTSLNITRSGLVFSKINDRPRRHGFRRFWSLTERDQPLQPSQFALRRFGNRHIGDDELVIFLLDAKIIEAK
jgi:hypothetical protein